MKKLLLAFMAGTAVAGHVSGQGEPPVRALPVQALERVAAPVAVPVAAVAKSVSATNVPPPARTEDTIELANGDTLRGKFLGWDAEAGVNWQHEAIKSAVTILPDKVKRLRLARQPARSPKENTMRLLFHNGDRLAVSRLSLDEHKASLDTWFAGTLKAPRAAISNVMFLFLYGDLLYQGPTGLEGWQHSSVNPLHAVINIRALADGVDMDPAARPAANPDTPPAWTFTGDAFSAERPGALGRDLKLPKVAMISFDLECQNYPALTLHLYSTAADKFAGMDALSFTFSGRMIYFRRWLSNGGSRQIGSADHARFGPGNLSKVRLTICADLNQQMVALYMDEALVRKWSVAGHTDGLGTALVFQQQGTIPLKISSLTVSRWNGVFEETSSLPVGGREDLLFLNNRDKISGRLLSLSEGKVKFQTAFTTMEIPLERLQALHFAVPKDGRSARAKIARLVLGDGSQLSLTIRKWDEREISGESPIFGQVILNPKAVAQMVFE